MSNQAQKTYQKVLEKKLANGSKVIKRCECGELYTFKAMVAAQSLDNIYLDHTNCLQCRVVEK